MFVIVVVIANTGIAAVVSIWYHYNTFDKLRDTFDSQASVMGDIVKQHKDESDLADYLKDYMTFVNQYSNSDILIVDGSGYVFSQVGSNYTNLEFNNFFDKEDMDELRNDKSIQRENKYRQVFNDDAYMYIKPVLDNGILIKAVAFVIPVSKISSRLSEGYSIIWFTSLIFTAISAYIIYYLTKKTIFNPLKEINDSAKKISKGEVQRRVKVNAKQEITELAESFNSMADSLEKVEKNRREFISNVSHELRSPITSIKGFIGGIMDGVIPKDKENYYLQITYEEIQRLTRLVNELLDLSAMEAGKFSLVISEIDINEIIRLSVIRFETRINVKKLKVDVVLQDEHIYAVGDRDRLIQVVTNLLDNAVKYVGDGGKIRVTTKTKGDNVLVSIFNDGPSISQEDLRHIWDRFYKSDKSRTYKQSTGLGLPIVRNILTQLGQDIWVENGEKQGVTFYFTLKKAY
ncbi:HAMP domain-containing protein [Clostridium sp. 19966]|nr:HAMP domain-containing protein [Clostridium sp. 19966]